MTVLKKADKTIATYRRLRAQPLWRLLAAINGPVIMGLLQIHLLEGERSVPVSVFHDRISKDLEDLRAQGEDLPQTAQAYVADWLTLGFLERRFPVGVSEEVYELSSAAEGAIRIAMSLVDRRTMATESRLTGVIHQLVKLAEETDINPETRIASLMAERNRIDRQIGVIAKGQLRALPDARALERIREIISLADGIAGDFRRVRDEFEQLNRDLRQSVLDNDGSRGEVLESLFSGVDLISESEAGRTFSAFWRLLIDPEQSATLEHALEQVLSREFATQLETRERRFLLRLTKTLLDQGSLVHEVLQHFARNLKQFVQSPEYLEQRRLNQLLKEAQLAALELKDKIKTTEDLAYMLQLTTNRLRSNSQWVLHDPDLHTAGGGMDSGQVASINLETVSELLAQSEIDFRVLRQNIITTLQKRSQVTIGEILQSFPATQGLGSIVGYLVLGSRNGVVLKESEIVSWQSENCQIRSARIPTIYFLGEQINELT